jgi:transposase-like protein
MLLPAEPTSSLGNDVRAWDRGGPFDGTPLGHEAVPVFEKAFCRHKRSVGKSGRMDETHIKIKGQWKYLYRALDKDGNTVDFLFRARRDRLAARRHFNKSIADHGVPETATIDQRRRKRNSISRVLTGPPSFTTRAHFTTSLAGSSRTFRGIA